MRGSDRRSGELFSYIDVETRVRSDHPLRTIRTIVNETLVYHAMAKPADDKENRQFGLRSFSKDEFDRVLGKIGTAQKAAYKLRETIIRELYALPNTSHN